MSDPLPPGWQQRDLADTLDQAQMQHVMSIMKKYAKDPDAALPIFKEYFASIAPQLQAGGWDPGYLSYALYAKMMGII